MCKYEQSMYLDKLGESAPPKKQKPSSSVQIVHVYIVMFTYMCPKAQASIECQTM